MRIVYSKHYDIGFFGLERLHPFDSRKYSRAWRLLRREFGQGLKELLVAPPSAVSRPELLRIHAERYLQQLRSPAYVAGALEFPPVSKLPRFLIDACVLRPMRWAVRGTMIAAEEARKCGLAINMSGGYHHAKPDAGEGFCIYSDIALAVDQLRRTRGAKTARVAYIDLDAHQGNGVCHFYRDDTNVFVFDMYNASIYPALDVAAADRVDCGVRMDSRWPSEAYLHGLTNLLPPFLDSVTRSQPVELAIYNAGTDVYEGDELGGLNVTAEHILERDLFVIDQLRQRDLPTVMLLSGGYSRESYKHVAASVSGLIKRYASDLTGGGT